MWDLHERALIDVGAFIAGHGPWDEDLKHIPEVYDNDGGAFLIAEYKSRVIGMGAIRRVNDQICELKRMRVQPEYQGRGLGAKMLHILEDTAKQLAYMRIILDTSFKQQAALHLYVKNGYVEYKRGKLGGLETVWMEKELNTS